MSELKVVRVGDAAIRLPDIIPRDMVIIILGPDGQVVARVAGEPVPLPELPESTDPNQNGNL